MPPPRRRPHPAKLWQHLLHFLRWWESVHHTDVIVERRHQVHSTRLRALSVRTTTTPGSPSTNAWLPPTVPCAPPSRTPPAGCPEFQVSYWRRAHGPWQATPRSEPPAGESPTDHRAIADDVARFCRFHTTRLGYRGLNVLQGLRSQEVSGTDDLRLPAGDPRARKRQQTALSALAPEAINCWITSRLERPDAPTPLSQGPARARMTPAGLLPHPLLSPDDRREARQPAPFPSHLASDMPRGGVTRRHS
jgi:hypothetical protein